MRMVKVEPQPILVDAGRDGWLLPSTRPGVTWGGLWFTYPIRSVARDNFGELIPCKGGIFGDKELIRIDGIWYWLYE